ncbi:MAG: hypothetical protein DMG24_07065 [Acidobacteria bacterium]|nr:MAG: hypothetical protein DMG24_07065 [Acidobacteriota bacterium]
MAPRPDNRLLHSYCGFCRLVRGPAFGRSSGTGAPGLDARPSDGHVECGSERGRVPARRSPQGQGQASPRSRHVEWILGHLDRPRPRQDGRASDHARNRRRPRQARSGEPARGRCRERGDALELIPKLEGPFDVVFIDAAKSDYVRYLRMVLPLVPPGGVIVAHNVNDLRSMLEDFIQAVSTNPQLRTTFVNAGPGGFSVSVKLPPR